MAVRVDTEGVRGWDYHTVGGRIGVFRANGTSRADAILSHREYLCDASFLLALQGDADTVATLREAVQRPKWTPYLGRKSCVPSRPLLENADAGVSTVLDALCSVPWRPRFADDVPPDRFDCYLDWFADPALTEPPMDAERWFDNTLSFDPPFHEPRYVIHTTLTADKDVVIDRDPLQSPVPLPPRTRADYANSQFRKRREERLAMDHGLCVFCKQPAQTVQHVTYVRAGGDEHLDDLRSLCRLCHDAVTMIEYGENMGIDRINPEDPRWRDRILAKRAEIVRFRSIETRRRMLSPEEV